MTNYRDEIVDTKLTTGNVHDIKPVLDITKKLQVSCILIKNISVKNCQKN
jgi:hypothetical protein